MNSRRLPVEIRRLTPGQRRELERRESRYRDKLARHGYTSRALVDESGCFGLVLVEDPASQRQGLLLPDGSVRWMDQSTGLGALADAAVSGVTIDGRPA